tara:strand:+ start:5624 stop:5761 length:138 start_codon:yes stop_codon:yes gene_type:complete
MARNGIVFHIYQYVVPKERISVLAMAYLKYLPIKALAKVGLVVLF